MTTGLAMVRWAMGSSHAGMGRLYVRLETVAGQPQRFWEVVVTGCALHTRHGRVGSDGKATQSRWFSDPSDALVEAGRRIVAKEKAGFQRVERVERVEPAASVAASDAELVEHICDAPDDVDGYLVYADWLQSRGDPRGELIALHHARERKPHDARVHRAHRAFHDRHGRMLPARISEACEQRLPGGATCKLDWRLGFVREAVFDRKREGVPYTVRELVAALLAHPSAVFLLRLAIGSLGSEPPHDYRAVLAAMTDAAPRALRTLHIADVATQPSRLGDLVLGDLGPLLASLPRLDTLLLQGSQITFSPALAPALRVLHLTTPALDRDLLQSLDGMCKDQGNGTSSWPRLAELALYGNDAAIDTEMLPGLLAGHGVPALRRLALHHTTATSALWLALAESALINQLDSLDLSHGDLADADVPRMLGCAASFAGLRQLTLDGNYLSAAVRDELRGLCAEVSIAEQRGAAADMPAITYPEIVDFAPDVGSLYRIGDVAHPRQWRELATWGSMLWGRYKGSVGEYDVFADIRALKSAMPRPVGCTCPSRKYPCKHTLGLMLIAEQGHTVPVSEPPPGLVERCKASLYDEPVD